jgi:predicted Rossmann fold nucleotide-binding protein DprA/Smf involved in DNA uptake
MTLSPDSQAMLLLCSRLGGSNDPEAAPLTLREWNPLARKLAASPLARPGALLGKGVDDLQRALDLPEPEAQRLARLLLRGGGLAIELERLAGLGIHPLTRADPDYPARYRQRLKESAPLVLFYAGSKELLGQPGLAVVGSRNLDEAGQACAVFVGNACAVSGLVLYSGGARGVDTLSMKACLESRGNIVGVLADSLAKTIRIPEYRAAVREGSACFVTHYHPEAGFSVGAAMGRNRLIYTLADHAIVVASDAGQGGTWGGATEALKAGWLPVFVLDHPAMPQGNRMLLEQGAGALPYPLPVAQKDLKNWLDEHAPPPRIKPSQPGLF